jgi:hypothetical protein
VIGKITYEVSTQSSTQPTSRNSLEQISFSFDAQCQQCRSITLIETIKDILKPIMQS